MIKYIKSVFYYILMNRPKVYSYETVGARRKMDSSADQKEALSRPDAAKSLAHKIEGGLSRKGQLEGLKPGQENKFVDELVGKWQHDGFVNPNGSFSEKGLENINNLNPYDDAHKVIEHMQSGETYITPVDQLSDTTQKAPESHKTDTLFPADSKESFDHSIELDQTQLDSVLEWKNGYVSREVGDALGRLIDDHKLSLDNFRLSNSPDHLGTDIKIFHSGGGDREYIDHQLLKSFNVENQDKPWWNFWSSPTAPH